MVSPLLPIAHISSAGLPQDLLIYDRHGTLLADIAQQGDHRIVVPLGSVAPLMLKATIAIEDRTFYRNDGLDFVAIARAAFDNLKSRRIVQGGSTITQQLAKQLFIGPHAPATFQRKMKEAILAMVLTNRYSKSAILETYLNTIYYSDQAYGVEAAAETYFHTSAASLTLAQASLLAGLPRAPTAYNPILHPQATHQRQLEVLAAMVKERYVSATEARLAGAARLRMFAPANTVRAPHFVRYVLNILRQKFHVTPWTRRAVKVFTSLDVALQDEHYTSRTCPHCDYVRSKVKGRVFRCPKCGWTYHRDGVGSINIRRKYLGHGPVVGVMAPPTGMRYHTHSRVARLVTNEKFDPGNGEEAAMALA